MLEEGKEEEILQDLVDKYYGIFEEADIKVQTYDEPANITVDRVIIALSNFIKQKYPNYHVLKSV